jgi:hypothetical protein
VRRDLWAKVTRALFYDLVALGEERDVGGKTMFGVFREASSSPWRKQARCGNLRSA